MLPVMKLHLPQGNRDARQEIPKLPAATETKKLHLRGWNPGNPPEAQDEDQEVLGHMVRKLRANLQQQKHPPGDRRHRGCKERGRHQEEDPVTMKESSHHDQRHLSVAEVLRRKCIKELTLYGICSQ